MRVLGVNAYHHDSAAAYIKNSKIVGASQEERFSRVKYDKAFPSQTIKWLRDTYEDYEFAVFSNSSLYSKFKSDVRKYTRASPVLVDHHKAHAMSSIITTDWDSCAVMVVDTVGDGYSTSLGYFDGININWIKQFRYPNSLGLFYSAATRLLGMKPLHDESKLMSAAAHGSPIWKDWIKSKVVDIQDSGYEITTDLTRGVGYGVLDFNIAASVQAVLEEALISLASWLYNETGTTKLAYAGGIALNCAANTKLLKYTPFKHIAIQPAAGDAGCAIGAAAMVERPLWENAYLGVKSDNKELADDYADRILKHEIVPVIQGRAEFGPRALGNRSYLCTPTDFNIKKLNELKGRETDSWRHYAPICLESEASTFFNIYQKSYDMMFVADIIDGNFTTCDNSARLQVVNKTKNPYVERILEKTRQYGYPILINTSLNARGKPLVNTVEDYENEIRLCN